MREATHRRSWISTSVAVLLALLLSSDEARADDPPPPLDRTKKAARWSPAVLEPGNGWWCNAMECSRSRPSCELKVSTCKEQRRVWAFSYYFWDPESLAGAWNASMHSTRAQCEEMRRIFSLDDPSGTAGEFSNISPCTRVGDRRLDGLPPGRGWWCTRARSVEFDVETSLCSRSRAECVAGTTELGTAEVTNAVGALKVIHACQRKTTAWAIQVGYPASRLKVFETQSDCDAIALGATCHKVK